VLGREDRGRPNHMRDRAPPVDTIPPPRYA
jgi:hypothetical protein